jgi:flagellin
MNSINTNMSALQAQNNMREQNDAMNQAMNRLSSGLRINSAADDAAGSAIASKMEAQVRSLDVAIRNSYDAISMTQTAEGALGEMENILQRVRELSVQASNSTLSTSDRTMIQAEIDALINEIDAIAGNTHFNEVKLLDGSNATVDFQIGIKASDALTVNLQNSDSISLGLSGSTGVEGLTSSRMLKTDYSATGAAIAASDIKINGFNAFSTDFNTNVSTATVNTAKTIADAINLNTGTHGANANAFNTFTSNAMGTFNMTATFTINGETVALASSYSQLVSNINESVSGINASLNADNSITLSNTTADEIIIDGGQTVGFTTAAQTFTGFIELSNLDGSQVTIEAGSVKNGYTGGAGLLSDVQAIGFNEFSKAGVLETDTVSGTALAANEVKVNDVLIGGSVTGAANHVADAINAKTAEHGVTADANNEIEMTFDFSAGASLATDFKINGMAVDLTSATSAANVVTEVNAAGIGDIRASANADGTVKLVSDSGVDIVVANSNNDILVSARDIHGADITKGLSNGVFDLDGLVSGHTVVAGVSTAIDISGSSLVGDVVDSRIVVTMNAAAAYANSANEGIVVRGTNSNGQAISETILFKNGTQAVGDQIFGSTNFHTVTSVENTSTDPLAGGTIDIGFFGNSDTDGLFTSGTFAGTLNGALNGTDINSYVEVKHSTASAATYTITGVGQDGSDLSETITMTNTANLIVSSENIYKSVTSIALATGASPNNAEIGTNTVNEDVVFSSSSATAAGELTLSTTGQLTGLRGARVIISGGPDVHLAADGSVNEHTGDYSGGNAVKFTVTGTDLFGATVTEEITLNKNTGQVHGTTVFDSITKVETNAALQAAGAKIGLVRQGDRVEAKGNMTLTNDNQTAIKLEAVADDHIAGLATTGAQEIIMQKLGAKNQSQSFEVTGKGVSVTNESQATASLAKIDAAIDKVSLFRSSFGAVENRIDASINNATTLKVNTEAAMSRIQDADFAAETSRMTKSQILSQAATSMLAQANASKQNLLALLQG